jgi:DNA-directed RNA polymerase
MKQKLIASVRDRLKNEISNKNPLKFMTTLDCEVMVDQAISVLYLYTRKGKGRQHNVYMYEVITAIGHGIRGKYKLKQDSALAAKAGGFLLYTFEACGLIRVVLGRGKIHMSYCVELVDDESLCTLWDRLPSEKTEKLPMLSPCADWETTKHPTGRKLIVTSNEDVLKITKDTHPIVFECVNRPQKIGWQINEDIYNIHVWAFRNKTDAFKEVWEMPSPDAKLSKLREIRAVSDIAKRFIGKVFYHMYYLDFRGRKYPVTAYLHEQGTDLAKGLLLRNDSKKIGRAGYEWLLISLASNWAGDAGRSDGSKTDKIPLRERIAWSEDNEELFMAYAASPKVNQGWMQADKPWQFLAACFELKKLREYQSTLTSDNARYSEEIMYGYESHLECYIDGSNNGSQHLSALTRDEITAPHVNLVPMELPGDLYKYVADHVWEAIDTKVSTLGKARLRECEKIIDNLLYLKEEIGKAPPKSDYRQELVDDIQEFKKLHDKDMDDCALVYWARVRDGKHRRKVVKRNVMTLPYGGTPYGLGQQQIDDARKHGIDILKHMEHRWGSYMGRLVYEDCRLSLKRPMQLLASFENAGKLAERRGEFLRWQLPITNFPVVQHYVEGRSKKIWVQYGPPMGDRKNTGYYANTYQVAISFLEDPIPSPRKQSQGAAPNAIHSLDACHLMLITHACDFPVTTIHDSFGSLLADMPALYKATRKTFVELYDANPLEKLMDDIGCDIMDVEFGSLSIDSILDSEYCFA